MFLVKMPPNSGTDLFIVNCWILRFAGLWPPENQSKIARFSYKFYAIFVFLFVNLYFTSTEFISLFSIESRYGFIKNINFFLTHLMGAIKVIFWRFQGGKLRKLMAILEFSEFEYKNLTNFNPTEIMDKYKRIGVKYTLMFFVLAHLTLSSSYIPPLISTINWKKTGNLTNFHAVMPYYSWMPFPVNTPNLHLLGLAYQAGPMFSYAYSIVGMDSLFMNIMNFIAAHFTVLQGAFRTIELRCKLLLVDNRNKKELNNLINIEMRKQCKHLQTIIKVCDELEETHRLLTFAQATATLFILCTCLYLVSITPIGSKQFFAEIVYMIAMGFQLFLYCWFGNEVTLKAREIPDSIWQSNWFNFDPFYKNCMFFTIMRMKKPIYMTVGKFALLTLQTFMQIIKTSYSVFALIKNTNK